jgi:hypothetical protein
MKLTLFSTPKPFLGHHIRTTQRNAIQSWMAVTPRPEIILMGQDAGVMEITEEFSLGHIPDIAVNPYGTPMVDDIFAKGETAATGDVLCYINTDIIVPPILHDIIATVQLDQFLMIGQRYDANIVAEIDFADPEWYEHIPIVGEVKLHQAWGVDYFIYRKPGPWGTIPPFYLGRLAWDNWLVRKALDNEVPVIDATQILKMIHQNHSRSHYAGGNDNIEVVHNRLLLGQTPIAGVQHATHKIDFKEEN